MIKRLAVFDFDGTLMNTPSPETGKAEWSEKTGKPFPYVGWWSKRESLDLNVFDIKPFPSVLNQLKQEKSTPNTYVIILTSRMDSLRPELEAVLNKNGVQVDRVDMKRANKTKGEKLLQYIEELPDLETIDVYEDRDSDIQSYEAIRNQIPDGIEFNIYLATKGYFGLTESSRLLNIIRDEIKKLI